MLGVFAYVCALPMYTTKSRRVSSKCLEKHGMPETRSDLVWNVNDWQEVNDTTAIHVAFFDNKAFPDTNSMQRAAQLVNDSSQTTVRFHAILSRKRHLDGFRVHLIYRFGPVLDCLYNYLVESAHGPGPQYMYKLFLPWILPKSIKRIVLLDSDTVVLRSITELWDSFKVFGSALVGLANEQNDLYAPMIGRNGGVQLLDLDGMRSSREYMGFMDNFNEYGYRIGYLGDQTFYTILGHLLPHLLYTVGCEWNRQLNTHFGASADNFKKCSGCALMHANQGPVKCIAKHIQTHQDTTCASWHLFVDSGPSCLRTNSFGEHYGNVQRVLRQHFASCCN